MRMKIFIIFMLIVFGIVAFFLFLPSGEEIEIKTGTAEVLSFGRAGDEGYAIVNLNGTGAFRILSLEEAPKRNLYILSEEGVGMESFDELMDSVYELEDYGFLIQIVGRSKLLTLKQQIILIPTGAMPDYILENIDEMASDNKIIYIGKTNFIKKKDLKMSFWVNELGNGTEEKLIIYDMTLDEFIDKGNLDALFDSIVENSWALKDKMKYSFEDVIEKRTLFSWLPETGYVSVIFDSETEHFLVDSGFIRQDTITIDADDSIFPWEISNVEFSINESIGKAFYSLEKNGVVLLTEELGRINEEKAFFFPFEFDAPGDYIMKIYDSVGVRGTERIHVKDIDISLETAEDVRYVFFVMIDDVPVESGMVYVSLNDGEEREYAISHGYVTVSAKTEKGMNIFKMKYLQFYEEISYESKAEDWIGAIIKFGIPGMIVILIIFAYVWASKKPMYKLRLEHSSSEKRKELPVNEKQIIETFEGVEKLFKWKQIPLTPKEIMIGLKKRITDGADISDGNLENILKKLMEKDLVESHLEYYQLNGWGDVKKNVLLRIIQDKLVEKGTTFKRVEDGFLVGNRVITPVYDHRKKKTIVVFEDAEEVRRFVKGMSEDDRAVFELKKENDILQITTLSRLDEIL
ncbi:hypothetical protein KAW38_00860 [Candidatus Micrarchaeota archaeon]|nr:hypothetical protein [Candidatus Micrarchaeota archaeon]